MVLQRLMAYLIQLLLPTNDNQGRPFDQGMFAGTHAELVERFGGVTAYLRAPARGLWQTDTGVDRDDIVILEVMAETLDRGWWADYRERLRHRFGQDELVARALSMERL